MARLAAPGAIGARVTVAVDSEETIAAAAAAGVEEVVVDVNVGLPRCGCAPDAAGALAESARSRGLTVRGVMGYEGHVVGVMDRDRRAEMLAVAMAMLLEAHGDVGGEVVSAGGTGTYDLNPWATEIQAGSYALMDSAYGEAGSALPPGTRRALHRGVGVGGMGGGRLRGEGPRHGPRQPDDRGVGVWFCSDEHLTFAPGRSVAVGDRVRVVPSHVDPTVAYHERMYVLDGEDVLETWPVDLRGW